MMSPSISTTPPSPCCSPSREASTITHPARAHNVARPSPSGTLTFPSSTSLLNNNTRGCVVGSRRSPTRASLSSRLHYHASPITGNAAAWRDHQMEDTATSCRRRRDWIVCCTEGIDRGGLLRKGIGGGGAAAMDGGEGALLPVRWIPERLKVAALVALVMCLCNADRVVMSVAIVPFSAKYGWSSAFLGIVQSSFLWGYLLSSAVGGALADKYGGKAVMACGAALWSLATILTPWAAEQSTLTLLLVRALFGLAEGVAIPCMNVTLSRWFPPHERASAVGFSMAGFHMGNVIGFLATPVIIARVGMSGPFALFSALGFVWVSTWSLHTVNDDPGGSSSSSAIRTGKREERWAAGSERPSIRHLLSKMPTWAIILANVTNNWGYFVLLSWMPVYFKTVFGVNLKQAAWFSAIPWGLMAISGYAAGVSSDYLIKSGCSLTLVRKTMQSIGFIGPGVALLCLNSARTPHSAAAFLTMALSLSSFSQAGFLMNMQDIAPNCAGFLHGIANSFGTLAAIISTIGTGYFVQWLGSFQAFLTLTSALYFVTAFFWNLHATGDQVFF